MLSRVFDSLRRYWGLEMKEGSASCLASRGHDFGDFEPPSNIPIVPQATFLGWIVSDDGGILASWQAMKAAVWAAFYANIRCRGWKRLGMRRRLTLLDRTIRPLLAYRLRIHGPTTASVTQLEKLQRHLVSRALGNFKLSTEDFKTFFVRASRQAKSHIGSRVSDWALDWVKGTLLWDAHLRRDGSQQKQWLSSNSVSCGSSTVAPKLSHDTIHHATSFSWAAALVDFMNAQFFSDRRRTEPRNLFGAVHTRTSTRAVRGHIHTRWHDSVSYSEQLLSTKSGSDRGVREFLAHVRAIHI